MDSDQRLPPLSEEKDIPGDGTTRIQRAAMRSLSMPSSIDQYAKEIRQLEDRILSEKGNLPISRRRLSRSRSTVLKPEDSVDEILSKLSHCNTEDDFILGDLTEADDPYAQPSTAILEKQQVSSFLPGLQSLDEDNEDGILYDAVAQDTMIAPSSSSVRNLPIEPIVEENADESLALVEEKAKWEQEGKCKALETVKALSGLFELPSTSSTDCTSSPVSVRDLFHMQCSVATSSTTETKDCNIAPGNTNNTQQQPRRSIFASRSSNTTKSAARSWSGFGIFALDDRSSATEPAVATTAPGDDDEEREPVREFRMLRSDDRANSLPSPLPGKSSMKRFPSMQSTSTVDSSTPNGKTVKRSVSFGKLETREYSIALSDHPSCSYGPPISLGWDFRDREAVELEQYEEERLPRRTMHQMLLSYNVRRYLLLKRAGYTHNELEQAMNEVDRVKRQRLVTDLLLPASKIDETLEDVMGHVKRMFGGGN